MGGTDLMDENINRFKIGMRAKKWYWSLITWMLDATIQNAWVLHKKSGNKLTQLEFRREIVQAYLTKYGVPAKQGGRPSSSLSSRSFHRVSDDIRYDGVGHLLKPVPNKKKIRCAGEECRSIMKTRCAKCEVALVAKTLPEPLQKIPNEVVQIVNYIKIRPLQSRLFCLLCQEIGSEHEHLLIHTEVMWLSRERILTRFFELRDEVCVFLLYTKYTDVITDFSWLCSTAYLADVFEDLNVLNLRLQGKNVDIFKVEDKISAMAKKCQLLAARIENESFTNFPNLKQFLESAEQSLPDPIKINAAEQLRSLATTFRICFPEPDPNDGWIRNSFS
ncbi:zinc finger BED domain-containing protein 5-like [Diabrotica undecimpunctata]|uniref:zinc finger BED domain-containing protein 5-like n=1 Tax=Diabrotica undecimpunctata TaxID=50387 RepID=UPI003B634941